MSSPLSHANPLLGTSRRNCAHVLASNSAAQSGSGVPLARVTFFMSLRTPRYVGSLWRRTPPHDQLPLERLDHGLDGGRTVDRAGIDRSALPPRSQQWRSPISTSSSPRRRRRPCLKQGDSVRRLRLYPDREVLLVSGHPVADDSRSDVGTRYDLHAHEVVAAAGLVLPRAFTNPFGSLCDSK